MAQSDATEDQASGSTLRRCLARWAETGLLPKVHALLVRMLRGHPDLIIDSCSVRAKRGGDLTGPNPTDRAKRGSKYHVAVDGDGVPVACTASAANVNDTLAFERLFLAAFAVMVRIRAVFADKGYDAQQHRDLCRRFGAEPHIHKRGQPRGSGFGQRRWPVERSNAWLLENKRLVYATTGSASSSSRCSRPHAYSWLLAASRRNSESRLLALLTPGLISSIID